MQPSFPDRKDIRWKGFDYTSKAHYFVTVNIHDRLHLLGEMNNDEVQLTAAGQMVRDVLLQIPEQFEGTEITSMVIMPNHVHLVLFNEGNHHLPNIMRWFKSITTNHYIHGVKELGWGPFNRTLWQRNYFDHVIRTPKELQNIVDYIKGNPYRWAMKYNEI
ncbi:MAG: transposase [Bacteroidales bacterium]|nr:transposase [Bacteroidales bacterium]